MSQISIIIPVYNAERTIIKCLDSIKAQTYSDFEVLLINDGSKDRSAEFCRKFCENDSRFKLINQDNAGPSMARNRGIDEATSKYLAFVDSDDYIEVNMLEELYIAAEKADADVTICGYCMEDSNQTKTDFCSRYRPGIYQGKECRKIALNAIDIGVKGNIPPYSCIRLVRRECLETPKLRFNTNIKRSEDYLLWNQVFFNINCLCLITDKILYHYVMRDDSITHSYIENYWDMAKIIYDELKNTLPKEKDIAEHLNFMFMRRAYLAMSIAVYADNRKTFCEDLKKALKSSDLRKAVSLIPLSRGIKKEKIRYLLLKFRLYFLIRIVYYYKYRKAH